MLFEKIAREMCGLDADGSPRCGFAINKEVYKIGDTTPLETYNRIAVKPSINISRLPGFDKTYIKVDIEFTGINNNDIMLILKYLNEYGKEITELTEESVNVPHITMTFVPLAYKGQYYFTATFPLFWCLTSKNLGEGANVLSILFDAETFNLFETDGLDYDKVIAISESEIAEQEAYEEALLEKEETKRELIKNRNNSFSQNTNEKSPTELFKQKSTGNDANVYSEGVDADD